MYKIKISKLETIQKNLKSNNKFLATLEQTPKIKKLIKDNQKQINELKDEFYID